jgi:hypothetical protein
MYNDLTIFRKSLTTELAHTERVETDDVYSSEYAQHIKCPAGFAHPPDLLPKLVAGKARYMLRYTKVYTINTHMAVG